MCHLCQVYGLCDFWIQIYNHSNITYLITLWHCSVVFVRISCYTHMGPCFILCSFAVIPVFITLAMSTLFLFLSGIVTSKIREQIPCFIYLLNNFSVTLFLSWGYLFVLFLYCRILLHLKCKTRTNQLFYFGLLTTPSKITKSNIFCVCCCWVEHIYFLWNSFLIFHLILMFFQIIWLLFLSYTLKIWFFIASQQFDAFPVT